MIEIQESRSTLSSYIEKDIFTQETKERVKDADILLLPTFEVMEGIDRAFQPDTVTFYKFSIANKNMDYKMELLENKGEEKILALHSFDIWIPLMLISNDILLPLATNLVSSYIYDRMKGRPHDEPTVHFNLLVENKEKGLSKHISYKGPAAEFKESFKKIDVNKLWEE